MYSDASRHWTMLSPFVPGARVAGSFLLVPPFLGVPLDPLVTYNLAFAEAFYA